MMDAMALFGEKIWRFSSNDENLAKAKNYVGNSRKTLLKSGISRLFLKLQLPQEFVVLRP
jgi:hypothetical protein